MNYSVTNYEDLATIHKQWKHVCIFGAGKLGTGECYELLKCEGFIIDGYFDNMAPVGKRVIDEIEVQDIKKLYCNSKDYFVFICVSNKIIDTIEDQFHFRGIPNYANLGGIEFARVMESIDNAGQPIKDRFYDIYDDTMYLQRFFRMKTGKELRLDNPRTFNEKLQWLKIHDKNPQYIELVDKSAFKKYVKKKIGEKYVIPTIGEWDRYEDINFDILPNKFVLKCTHDSGSIVVVEDKDSLDHERVKKRLNQCLSVNYYWFSREWPYRNVKRRIIAEEYVSDDGRELKDYKLFCFDGQVKLIQVDFDRFIEHKRNIYDLEWNYIPLTIEFPTSPQTVIERPKCLDQMINIASVLSKGIPHVRVDFYVINDKPLVGEMTFFHGGGIEKFTPEEWNYKMGEWIKAC